jgi:hypothetical protein
MRSASWSGSAAEPGEEEALAIERAQMQAGARIAEDLQTVRGPSRRR